MFLFLWVRKLSSDSLQHLVINSFIFYLNEIKDIHALNKNIFNESHWIHLIIWLFCEVVI